MPARTRPRLVRKPTITLGVPRTPDVIAIPIIIDGERNDRNAECRNSEIRKRTHFTAIVER
jgi:hypothetical protein